MLPHITLSPEGTHRSSIVWLHGLGADGYDFESIATDLELPEALGVKFILPHAPRRPITINGGMVMRGWYDIAYTDIGRTPDLEGIRQSLDQITEIVDQETHLGIPPDRILIAGFSQGGVMALEAITQKPGMIKGAIALSGYLARPGDIPQSQGVRPIYLAHGTQDPIVPFTLGVNARDELVSKGYEVTWSEWPMAHSVCMEEIESIRSWIIGQLSS